MKFFLHAWFWCIASAGFVMAQGQEQSKAAATAPRAPGQIVVSMVVGEAFAMAAADPQKTPLTRGMRLAEGQVITTGKAARVVLVFSNGATVNLGAESVLSIDEFLQNPFADVIKVGDLQEEPTTSTTKLHLVRGELVSNVKKLRRADGSIFTIETPVGAAGIRGTTFRLAYRPQGNRASFALTMIEGTIELIFKTRNRPVMVSDAKELILTDIEIDPTTGEVLNIPNIGQPRDVTAAAIAALSSWLQQLMEAGASVSFEPTLAANQPAQAFPQTSGLVTDEGTVGTQTTPADTGGTSPLPAPPATVPPPRTTPGDGQP